MDDPTAPSKTPLRQHEIARHYILTRVNRRFRQATVPADDIIKPTGSATDASQTYISDESKVKVASGQLLEVVFKDVAGTIYRTGSFTVPTVATRCIRQLTLTAADIGLGSVLMHEPACTRPSASGSDKC